MLIKHIHLKGILRLNELKQLSVWASYSLHVYKVDYNSSDLDLKVRCQLENKV